jgi:hypothetical protein
MFRQHRWYETSGALNLKILRKISKNIKKVLLLHNFKNRERHSLVQFFALVSMKLYLFEKFHQKMGKIDHL